ncbi:OmpH family outer membrane protein [Roseisalinus antarcticus]|uniref:Outer membrane protein (OmpH-like) n=1 Tax=Roseisalinus antarcticus TaxID=254357 RepID=A0A1Y5RE62_9RHOB|nr:OmpH family outer membrane protein [Roseisalinus antarcticus]SLN15447.1 Outer membrane protein (OmpH-like) [Roseisalinus antarcticus]
MCIVRALVQAAVLLAAALLHPGGVAAQDVQFPVQDPEVVRSPVLTIDPDLLFSESMFGQRIAADIQSETEALAAENRRIADQLEAEEKALTEARASMEPEEFRAKAAEFDTRVQDIRRAQDAKERDIGTRVQEAQEAFLNVVRPILGRLMIERGAAVILDRRTVVLGVGAVDITETAITRIDAEMGDGPGLRVLENDPGGEGTPPPGADPTPGVDDTTPPGTELMPPGDDTAPPGDAQAPE